MRTLEQREAICRAVLTAPIATSAAKLAKQHGLSPVFIRNIQFGRNYANLCPDLPRIKKATYTCLQCKLRNFGLVAEHDEGLDRTSQGKCSIGIPESTDIKFAATCAAFVDGGQP